MSKTRHREYMDAIKHTKKRLKVGYSILEMLIINVVNKLLKVMLMSLVKNSNGGLHYVS